jgi:hypothetical protein
MTQLAAYLVLLVSLLSPVQEVVTSSATRGITGRVRIESNEGILRGRPDLDLESPLLVRLAAYEDLGDGRFASELDYIGTVVGTFDLRDVLVFESGAPVTVLAPIPVEIVSNLSTDAPTDLVMAPPPASSLEGGYSIVLVVICILWLLVPVVVLARRLVRRAPAVVAEPPALSIGERIAPIVEAAASRRLSIDEQGRLELLLYAHWQEELGFEDDRAVAVGRLRRHEVAGELLRAVERWLHDPDGPEPDEREIADLLEPYRIQDPASIREGDS